MKRIDETMEWEGFGNGFGKWPSRCRIRVYDHEGLEIVVATEDPANPGTSITNCLENVAMMAVAKHDIDFKKLVFIQHDPEIREPGVQFAANIFRNGKIIQPEQFAAVTFEAAMKKNPLDPSGRTARVALGNPTWKPLKKAHVESLIGEAVGE